MPHLADFAFLWFIVFAVAYNNHWPARWVATITTVALWAISGFPF